MELLFQRMFGFAMNITIEQLYIDTTWDFSYFIDYCFIDDYSGGAIIDGYIYILLEQNTGQ